MPILPAASQDADKTEGAAQKRVFGRVLDHSNIHACFRRVYAVDHLAAHPRQNVRTMRLLVTGIAGDDGNPQYDLAMGMTFRKAASRFETSGTCGSLGGSDEAGKVTRLAHCSIVCDGGALDVSFDNAAAMISIPQGARIWKAGTSGNDDLQDERARFGSDDKIFRLDQAGLTECLGLANQKIDKDEMRRGQ